MEWKLTARAKGLLARLAVWWAGLGTAALAVSNCASCPAGGCVKCALCLGALGAALAVAGGLRPGQAKAVPRRREVAASFRFPPRL